MKWSRVVEKLPGIKVIKGKNLEDAKSKGTEAVKRELDLFHLQNLQDTRRKMKG
jgi:hypothetical protein